MNEKLEIKTLKTNILSIVILAIAIITVVNTILLISIMLKPKAQMSVENSLLEQREMYKYAESVFEKCVKHSEFEIVKTDYSERISGNIKNSSEKDLYDIRIELMCYDAFGEYIGLTSVFVAYLPANTSIKINDYVACDETEDVKILHARAVYEEDLYP